MSIAKHLLVFALAFSPLAAEKFAAYFSPEDNLAAHLVELIDGEQKSVQCAIYCLTHAGIAQALTRAKERGVAVELIIDPQSLKGRAHAIEKMRACGIPLYVYDASAQGKKRKSLMHDKFCIFGDRVVWTGSFNFTQSANASHCENAVVLEDARMAAAFQREFKRMKGSRCQKL